MLDEKDFNKMLKLKRLDKQNTFRFMHEDCGQCCKHREDILLTPYDIFRICKFLHVGFGEFIMTYCETYIESSSNLPAVRLRPSAVCKFLRHKKCQIYEVKPTVCTLYPLGRLASFNQESGELQYALRDFPCGTKDQANVEEDQLKKLDDDHKECLHIWHSMLNELNAFSQNTAAADEEAIEMMGFLVFKKLYDGYDHSAEFLPQFKERLENVKELCEVYKR